MKSRRGVGTWRLGAGLLVLLAVSSPVVAQCYEYPVTRIGPPTPAPHDFFGNSLDVQDDVLVVGAPHEDHSGVGNAGSAYVYRRVGGSWVLEATLVGNPIESNAAFGTRVAIDGDRIVVSASQEDFGGGNLGAVYSYRYVGGPAPWSFEAKFNHGTYAQFGLSLDLDGDRVVAGTVNRAWVYRWSGTSWTLEAELLPADPITGSGDYGFSVAINDPEIVVGAIREDEFGRAHIFERSGTTWTEIHELEPIDPPPSSNGFGHSLTLHDDVLLVGDSRGAGYVYRKESGSWNLDPEVLVPSDDDSTLQTEASSCDPGGNLVVLGQVQQDDIIVFRRVAGEWVEEVQLGPDPTTTESFGRPIVIDGGLVFVGAPREPALGQEEGAVYVYEPTLSLPFTFVGHPQDVADCEGGAGSFEVEVQTVEPGANVEIAWQRDGVDLPGETSSSLLLNDLQLSDDGAVYRARVTVDGCTIYSDEAVLTVVPLPGPPSGLLATPSAICNPGDAVTLTATAEPGTEIVWREGDRDGPVVGVGDSVLVTPTGTTTYFARARRLLAPICEGADSTVTVTLGFALPSPVFVSASETEPVCPATEVTLTASAVAGTIEWRADSCTGPIVGTGTDLTVAPLVTTTYYAVAIDGVCESPCVEQHTIEIIVVSAPLVSASRSITCPGEPVTLSAVGGGGTLRWYEGSCADGALLAEGVSELVVSPTVTTQYSVEAFDDAGTGCASACVSVTLEVDSGPTIVEPPVDVAFCRGGTVALAVAVTTPSPEAYQWLHDGVPLSDDGRISGAQSSSLTIDDAGDADQGSYSVRVTNACSEVESSPATVARWPAISSVSTDAPATTLGGTLVTVSGAGLDDITTCRVQTPYGEFDAPDIVSQQPTSLELLLPPLAPGCDCYERAGFEIDLIIAGPCGEIGVREEGLSTLPVLIERIDVVDGLQAAVDAALPGSCLRLVSLTAYDGPVELDQVERLTITGPPGGDRPLVARVEGESVAGAVPVHPTLRLSDAADDVCIAHIVFEHGNTGVEFDGGSGRLYRCQVTKNILSDETRGGGITVTGGAAPLIYECDVLGNRTEGNGGGIRVVDSEAIVLGGSISSNHAVDGGGIAIERASGPVWIIGCSIGNHAGEPGMGGEPPVVPDPTRGGGILWTNDPFTVGDPPSTGVILGNVITSNFASMAGGGIFLGRGVAVDVVGNRIAYNEGTSELSVGGGVHVANDNRETFQFCENFVHDNEAQRGGGIFLGEKCELVAERNFVLCNEAVQRGEFDPKDPPPPYYAAGVLSNGSEVDFDHNTVMGNTGASPGLQSGGFHHEGAAVYPFRIRNNVFMLNEGLEVLSEIWLPSGHFNHNLGYDSSLDPSSIFSVCSSGCETASIFADPLVTGDCSTQSPWDDFVVPVGSPASGSAADGFDRGAVPTPGFELGLCVTFEGDLDGSGLPDELEEWAQILVDEELFGELPWVRADCNIDGGVDIADAIFLLSFLFSAGPEPSCDDACDANDDGAIDVGDSIATLSYLFSAAPIAPPTLATGCGVDPTPDALECLVYPCP